MLHPVRWERPVVPTDLELDGICLVDGGAHAAGVGADALVLVDGSEHERRYSAGLGGVTSLGLIDALMNLPLRTPVRRCDLDPATVRRLAAAPDAVVSCDHGWVTRLLTPPLTVVAVVVRGGSWEESSRRARPFAAFAQCIVLLDRMPTRSSEFLWEAQLAGVGVWVESHGEVRELLAPEPFTRHYWKPAGWRFSERAYRAKITSSAPPASSRASEDRPARTALEGCGLLPRVLPDW